MPGGRPRKPAEVLEMSGAFKKNPARKRARAAILTRAAALGDPPAEWMEGAEHNPRCAGLLKAWLEIVAQDVYRKLNVSHRILVENTCHLIYKIRRASQGYGKATSGDHAQVTSNLAKMFMTPVDGPRAAEAAQATDRTRPGSGWGELVG